jgi:hypothetical protein
MSFTRKRWIVLLGYPLDLKDSTTLVEVCAPFATVLHWNSEDASLSRVLLEVLLEDPLEILRGIVIKMGRESNGNGRSWKFPIYVFNSEISWQCHLMKKTRRRITVIHIHSMAQFS